MHRPWENKLSSLSQLCCLGCALLILVLSSLTRVPNLQAQNYTYSEDQIKAAYIFNLINFITWPEPTPAEPFRIGILGNQKNSPFIETFNNVVENENFKGRSIEIENLLLPADFKRYHVIFIKDSNTPDLPSILTALKTLPILTIGESEFFCQQGGMTNLLRKNNRIKLEVNLEAAKAASLNVSSKILRIAAIIGNKEK